MVNALFLAFLLLLSGACSGAETAITAMDNLRLESLIEEQGDPQGLYRLAQQQRSRLITTLLLVNNFVNIGIAALATTISIQWLGSQIGALAATVPTTIVVLLFGEVAPKSLAVSHPLGVFRWVVRPVHALSVLLRPFIQAFEWIVSKLFNLLELSPLTATASLKDLELLIDVLGQRGLLDWQKRRLFRGALALDMIQARDVAKPRVKMETISHDKTLQDVVKLCLETGYSRIPVQGESKDEIVGIIHLKQALRHLDQKGNGEVTKAMSPPFFVPDTKRISSLLKEMLRSRQHLGIVVDEFGGTTGLITLEDVLEELVGDIYDESDLSPLLLQRQRRQSSSASS
ncbi:hemolysin family protein [Thermostichus vulcanus]|uniref:HlyC/CorC family transporter n=1 Tax=Thermostichus vulcanus str. 'Rupite' TaxID=2813851 RepID=A0ABT0CEE9_THEVL|nr:hemolysin family protein [Thermostichus vulcanus]MCJ2544158.1 HlyC/CorC family transporter [Thermostichus vulcanus str. 'Rupite']